MRNRILTLLCAAFGFFSASAFAVDGLTLINHATVVAAGGYPYSISQAGSYQLSGNLHVTASALTGINITSSNVTLDLNGFSIICSGTLTIAGIEAPSTTGAIINDVQVKNGTVTGCGNGVVLFNAANVVVESLRVSGYGSSVSGGHLIYGITASSGIVRNNTTLSNGNSGGIYLGSGLVSSNNLSGDEIGITVAGQSVVTGNSVSAASTGLLLLTGSTGNPLVGTNIFNASTPFAAATVLSQHNNFCNNSSC
jgi:hypothetical protein